MNEPIQPTPDKSNAAFGTAGAAPPVIPPLARVIAVDPNDQMPITGWVGAFEAILRQPRRVMHQLKQPDARQLITLLLLIALICAVVYGVVVGTFSGGDQLWSAPVKIAGGLLIAALICLPSLYIFSCLSGSEARLVEVFGLIAGLLALMTVLLIGFAPVAWVFSQSTKSLAAMGALHLGFWLVATFFGLRFLHAGFVQTNAKSTSGLNLWIIIFLLVALQMTTALRPIIGTSRTFLPDTKDKQFFITHWVQSLKNENLNRD